MRSTSSSNRLCPRPGCPGEVTTAAADALRDGAPLWTCSAGHHGPTFTGFDGYSDHAVMP